MAEKERLPEFIVDESSDRWHISKFADFCDSVKGADGKTLGAILFGEAPSRESVIDKCCRYYNHPEDADGGLLPHQGLLLAFLNQLKVSRRLLNAMPERHLKLYYHEFLSLTPVPQVADRVMLSVVPQEALQHLPAGTFFNAGQDDQGTPLRYRLDDDLWANQGQLTDILYGSTHHIVDGLDPYYEKFSMLTLYSEEQGIRLREGGSTCYPSGEEEVTYRLISHDYLATAGGERVVKLTFNESLKVLSGSVAVIEIAVFTEKKWVDLQPTPGTDLEYITCTLPAALGEIKAPTEEECLQMHLPFTGRPLMKLKRMDSPFLPPVKSISIKVNNLSPVYYCNGEGLLDAEKKSTPFGHDGYGGKSFSLMSPDWLKNQKFTVDLVPEWHQNPADSLAVYKQYRTFLTENKFPDVSYGEFIDKSDALQTLTTLSVTCPGNSHAQLNSSKAVPVAPAYSYTLTFTGVPGSPVKSTNPDDWPFHLEFSLPAPGFMPEIYQVAISMPPELVKNANIPGNPLQYGAKGQTLRPPFQAVWNSLSVAYNSEDVTVSEQWQATPFGFSATEVKEEQCLFLGLKGIEAGEMLSLYGRIATSDTDKRDWYYLTETDHAEVWKPLTTLSSDTTEHLTRSGIVRLTIPDDAKMATLLMPSGRLWLKTPVTNINEDYPLRILGLHTNAVMATLASSQTVAPSHFVTALPAGTVSSVDDPDIRLAAVNQPWDSEGGAVREGEPQFYRRIARLLRHRNRALNWQDINDLLLERFSGIHSISLYSGQRMGRTVIVIPGQGHQDNADTLRPQFRPSRLEEMRQYILSHSSAWMALNVTNAAYVDITLSAQVTFVDGETAEHGLQTLNTALKRQFMPWTEDGSQAVVEPGKSLNVYEIIAWIEGQDYVSSLSDVSLKQVDSTSNTVDVTTTLGTPKKTQVYVINSAITLKK